MTVLVNNKDFPHIRVGLEKDEWIELHGELFSYYKKGALSVNSSLSKLINKHGLKIDDNIIELFKMAYNG